MKKIEIVNSVCFDCFPQARILIYNATDFLMQRGQFMFTIGLKSYRIKKNDNKIMIKDQDKHRVIVNLIVDDDGISKVINFRNELTVNNDGTIVIKNDNLVIMITENIITIGE